LTLLLLMGHGLIMLCICTDIIICLVFDKYDLVKSLPDGLVAQEMSAQSQSAATVSMKLQIIAENMMFVIADTIIVWRAWVIWAESRKIQIFMVIVLLVDLGVNIADGIVDARVDSDLSFIGRSTTLDWIVVVINLTVNTTATLLIVYRAWKHHQSKEALSLTQTPKTQVEAILMLLIESGALFAAIQVLYIVFSVLDESAILGSPVNILYGFIAGLYEISSAFNPVAIVILVQTKKHQ